MEAANMPTFLKFETQKNQIGLKFVLSLQKNEVKYAAVYHRLLYINEN